MKEESPESDSKRNEFESLSSMYRYCLAFQTCGVFLQEDTKCPKCGDHTIELPTEFVTPSQMPDIVQHFCTSADCGNFGCTRDVCNKCGSKAVPAAQPSASVSTEPLEVPPLLASEWVVAAPLFPCETMDAPHMNRVPIAEEEMCYECGNLYYV